MSCSYLMRQGRWPADVLRSSEGLDDKHRRTAVPAEEGGSCAGVLGRFRDRRWWQLMQQLSDRWDIVLAVGVGEQPVVADAVKAGGQDMQQEAAHELLGRDGHHFAARSAVLAIVFPAERDVLIVRGHEA